MPSNKTENLQALNHLAIIMDGNGRWAKKRFLPRVAGHKAGMDNVKTITIAASHLGIKVLTLYAFSTENWGRPNDEVDFLMKLPVEFFDKFMPDLMAENVKVQVMGFLDQLPQKTYEIVQKAINDTKDNTGLILNFALNYGSRKEIVKAAKEIANGVKLGQLDIEDISEEIFDQHLMTNDLPFQNPDLLIRTSGEMRISNFLLWQLAYSEMEFTPKYWPDFNPDDLKVMIAEFQNRERRFGKI